jgi:hypothetical protein
MLVEPPGSISFGSTSTFSVVRSPSESRLTKIGCCFGGSFPSAKKAPPRAAQPGPAGRGLLREGFDLVQHGAAHGQAVEKGARVRG